MKLCLKITLAALFLFLITYAKPVFADVRHPLFVTNEQLEYLRTNPHQFAQLKKICDHELTRTPKPIADFTPPLTYIDRKNEETYSRPLKEDGAAAYAEAICYRVTNDARYAKKAEEILDSWSLGVKHISSKAQGAYDFIFNFHLYIITADLLRDDNSWDNKTFAQFLQNKVLPACEWTLEAKNNIGNWATLEWLVAGLYLNDETMISQAKKRWDELLNSQIAEDGSLPLEICRTNSINNCGDSDTGVNGLVYTHWALTPATIAAEIMQNQGLDPYSSKAGGKLGKAYKLAAKWTLHPESFPYYNANNGKINTYPGIAYFAILQRQFPNKDGAAALLSGNIKGDNLQLLLLYPPQEN